MALDPIAGARVRVNAGSRTQREFPSHHEGSCYLTQFQRNRVEPRFPGGANSRFDPLFRDPLFPATSSIKGTGVAADNIAHHLESAVFRGSAGNTARARYADRCGTALASRILTSHCPNERQIFGFAVGGLVR